jgi:aryl-alcohol dehydrogenase-like predicted oxidoreductase
MRYRLLSNSGLRVSEAALGTMSFGDGGHRIPGVVATSFQEYSLWQNSRTSVQFGTGTRTVHA